jgi:hypothetical protein
MDKVIVERPRHGGGLQFPRSADRELHGNDELAIRREGMRRPWMRAGLQKGLNENLAPLRRYLLSNINRPWNKVFSEICESLNFNSAVQLHIWQHIQQFVAFHPIPPRHYFFFARIGCRWEPFFVDQRSGLLRKNEASPYWKRFHHRRERKQSPNFVAAGKGKCYRRIEGIWYEFELAPLPAENAGLVDVALKRKLRETSREQLIKFHGAEVYAVRKRQLNTKEIRRLTKANAE